MQNKKNKNIYGSLSKKLKSYGLSDIDMQEQIDNSYQVENPEQKIKNLRDAFSITGNIMKDVMKRYKNTDG